MRPSSASEARKVRSARRSEALMESKPGARRGGACAASAKGRKRRARFTIYAVYLRAPQAKRFTQRRGNALTACGNSRETCDLANVSDVYTAWPWERARNGSDRKISGSSVARSWARRRMHFTIG